MIYLWMFHTKKQYISGSKSTTAGKKRYLKEDLAANLLEAAACPQRKGQCNGCGSFYGQSFAMELCLCTKWGHHLEMAVVHSE